MIKALESAVNRVRRSQLSWVLAFFSLGFFVFTLFTKTEFIDLRDWNNIACFVKDKGEILTRDCLFTRRKYFLFALPGLSYGQSLDCRAPTAQEEAEYRQLLLNPRSYSEASNCALWKAPYFLPEIGWDSYEIWYGRAVHFYYAQKSPTWPGIWNVFRDEAFIKTLPSPDSLHYPALIPYFYSLIMKLFDSAHPVIFITIHFLLWIAALCLLRLSWPSAPKWLWVVFAFAPIGARFLFKPYADIWVICFLLAMLVALDRKILSLVFLSAFVLTLLKLEGWIQGVALLLAYVLVSPSLKEKFKSPEFLWGLFGVAGGSLLYYFWYAPIEAPIHQVSLLVRLLDPLTYTTRLPQILGYYLDVLFRPGYWALLWPLVFFQLWQFKKNLGIAALVLLFMISIIPVAFLKFPDGAYREVVLTGSNRALWQLLPLAWLLMRELWRIKALKPEVAT